MDKKRSYLALVWEKGKWDTQEYYRTDQRSWVFNIGSALIVAIISPIIYVAMGLIIANQLGLSVIAGIISGAIFLALWFLGVFIYHLVNAPARLYKEQEDKTITLETEKKEEINLLQQEVNKIRLELEPDDPIELTEIPPYTFTNSAGRCVGVEIFNKSTYSVNCSVSLMMKSMDRPVALHYIQPESPHYSPSIDISRKTPQPFYIACTSRSTLASSNTNAYISFVSNEPERRVDPGKYEVLIIINGEDSNHKPLEHSETFILIYEGEDNLELRKKTTDEERNESWSGETKNTLRKERFD